MIIVGQLATADGASWASTVTLTPSGRGATEQRSLYTSPAAQYRATQPAHIGVDIDHQGREIGEVAYLAQRPLGLYGVLQVDDDAIDTLPFPMYLSSEIEGRHVDNRYEDIELLSVAICAKSAVVAKQQALVVAGDIDDAHAYHANPQRDLLREAAAYCKERRYRTPTEHRIAGTRIVETNERGNTFVDNERAFVKPRSGRYVPLPTGGYGEIEYSVPYNGVLRVR